MALLQTSANFILSPWFPEESLQERPGARLRRVTAAVRGAAAAGDRAALTRRGQVQPPGPHCSRCYASPAETLFARRSQTQVPRLGTRCSCSNCLLWALVWVPTLVGQPQPPHLTLAPVLTLTHLSHSSMPDKTPSSLLSPPEANPKALTLK